MGTTGELNDVIKRSDSKYELHEDYGCNLKILSTNDQVKELQTILRDRLE